MNKRTISAPYNYYIMLNSWGRKNCWHELHISDFGVHTPFCFIERWEKYLLSFLDYGEM